MNTGPGPEGETRTDGRGQPGGLRVRMTFKEANGLFRAAQELDRAARLLWACQHDDAGPGDRELADTALHSALSSLCSVLNLMYLESEVSQ